MFCGFENSFKSIGSCLFLTCTELLTFKSVQSIKVILQVITFSVWGENISSVPALFFIGKELLGETFDWMLCRSCFLYISWNFFVIFFFAAVRFLSTSWWLINTSWITLVEVHDVEKPKIPKDLGKNITNDVVRGS